MLCRVFFVLSIFIQKRNVFAINCSYPFTHFVILNVAQRNEGSRVFAIILKALLEIKLLLSYLQSFVFQKCLRHSFNSRIHIGIFKPTKLI